MFKFSQIAFIEAFSINLEALAEYDLDMLSVAVAAEKRRRQGPVELDLAEKCLVRCGQTIPAIKALRARLGLGLREAKDAVDAFRDTIPERPPGGYWSEAEGKWLPPVNR